MEAYPIIIDGELAGKLTVDRQGALTAFHAECSSLPGLVRLSVYGGGREGYLGVLAPEGEKLTLHKSLSRAAMREFPPEIESVERAGLDRAASPKGEETPEPAAETGSAHGGAPEEPEAAEPEKARTEPSAAATAADAVPAAPAPEEAPQEELFWYSSPDGALVCFDGSRTLLALPPEDPRIPADAAGERRTVEGRDYIVFPAREDGIIR